MSGADLAMSMAISGSAIPGIKRVLTLFATDTATDAPTSPGPAWLGGLQHRLAGNAVGGA
jgi:hypothetical protein